jgi:hypothetical protein
VNRVLEKSYEILELVQVYKVSSSVKCVKLWCARSKNNPR